MGKYTHFKDILEKFRDEGSHAQKVEEAKKGFRNLEFKELIAAYEHSRRLKDDYKEILSQIQVSVDALKELLETHFEDIEIRSANLDSGGRIRFDVEVLAKVVERDIFREWCISNKLERELRLHHKTMESLTRIRLIQGLNIPEGVQAFFRNKIVYTAPKTVEKIDSFDRVRKMILDTLSIL